jgi:hypothetical protein
MNVPLRGGASRASATSPQISLVIDDEGITFVPRGPARALIGPFRIQRQDVLAAYRLRGSVLRSGVGIDTRDGQTAYFWTRSAQDQILASLADVGVPVDPSPRRPALWSRSGPSPSVHGAPLSSWARALLPVGMAAGTILMIIFEMTSGPLLWHLGVAIMWMSGLASSFRLWRSGRISR